MAELLRPDLDDADGAWTNQAGSNVDLFNSLDEVAFDNSDYIKSNATNDVCRLRLSDPSAAPAMPMSVSYRPRKYGSEAVNLIVRLKQGVTLVAQWTDSAVPESFATATQALTQPQFDAITDFTDLFLEFEADVADLLLEDGSSLLLEDGGKLLLEGSPVDAELSALDEATSADFLYGIIDDRSRKIAPDDVSLERLQVSYAGGWDYDYPFVVVANRACQDGDGSTFVGSGVFINEFTYTEQAPPINQLTSLSFPNLAGVAGNFAPTTMNALTTLDLPNLAVLGGNFSPTTMNALTTLTLPNLRGLGGSFRPFTMPALTTLSVPKLVYCNEFSPGIMNALTTLDAPNLKVVGIGGSSFAPAQMASLTTLSFPSLEVCRGNFGPAVFPLLTTFDFPVLKYVLGLYSFQTCQLLATMSLPSLQSVGGVFQLTSLPSLTTLDISAMVKFASNISIVAGTEALTTVTMPPVGVLKAVGGNWVITSATLSQQSVDDILVVLAALDGTAGTTAYSNLTVTLKGTYSSPPSATGLAAKATLQARGCTVTHN